MYISTKVPLSVIQEIFYLKDELELNNTDIADYCGVSVSLLTVPRIFDIKESSGFTILEGLKKLKKEKKNQIELLNKRFGTFVKYL